MYMLLTKIRNSLTPLVKGNKHDSAAFTISTSPKSTSSSKPMEQKIKIGKYHINCLKVDNGSHHLLCMPGAYGTIWTHCKQQVEGLNREKFTIVAWDPPGYGESRPPERDFDTYMFHKDADAAYELMQALNIPKYSILGWCNGGTTGMIHAVKYPNAVKKLVIWGSNSFILPQDLESFKKITDNDIWTMEMRDPMIDIYGEETLAKYWSRWMHTMNNLYNKGNICAEMLKDIKCPTFILHGVKDSVVDKYHVSHLHAHIKDSKIHLYPEGKHNIHVQYAEDFNRKVEEFLLQP